MTTVALPLSRRLRGARFSWSTIGKSAALTVGAFRNNSRIARLLTHPVRRRQSIVRQIVALRQMAPASISFRMIITIDGPKCGLYVSRYAGSVCILAESGNA
jgi:hypothetical protein